MPTSNITVSPTTATGSRPLSITATEHTGRLSRSATFSASGVGEYASVISSNRLTVIQAAKPAFIDMANPSTTSSGGEVTSEGTSNMESLTLGAPASGNNIWDYLETAYVNGVEVTKADLTNGYLVDGDPGATAEYPIRLVFDIPVNASGATYSGTLGGKTIMITQEGGSGTILRFSSTVAEDYSGNNIEVSLTAAGDAFADGVTRTISVEANPSTSSWVVS